MEKCILPELVAQALASAGKQSTRKCTLTNEVMIWVVLAMGLFTEMPIRQVFKAARRLRKDEASPLRSSLCMARQRLGSEPLVELHRLVVKPLATEQTPGAFYHGMRNPWLIPCGRWSCFRRRNSEEPFWMFPIARRTDIWDALRAVAAKDRFRKFAK